jgi:hypothetical protein
MSIADCLDLGRGAEVWRAALSKGSGGCHGGGCDMLGIWGKWAMLVGLCFFPGEDQSYALPRAEMAALEGEWVSNKGKEQEHLLVVGKPQPGSEGVPIRLKIGTSAKVDYYGFARFYAVDGERLLVLGPPGVITRFGLPEGMLYKVEGGRLVLQVPEGKYKGTYKFQRANK